MYIRETAQVNQADLAEGCLAQVIDEIEKSDYNLYQKVCDVLDARPKRYGRAPSAGIAEKWRFGEVAELLVATILLGKLGFTNVEWATVDENKYKDIDLYVDGIPVSVKAKSPRYFSGDAYLFEMYRYSAKHGAWSKSWYYETEAEAFCIIAFHPSSGVELTWIDKEGVDEYTKTKGFDFEKGLNAKTLQEQAAHNQSNTRNGFIYKRNLKKSGVAKVIYDSVVRKGIDFYMT